MSKPVLTMPKINWGNIKVSKVYPRDIGDLFAGQQVTVMGRYTDTGAGAVTLEGTVKGRKKSQSFEGTYGADPGNTFIEKLWASREVGFLLDEIRLKGEKKELKDEVIRLSRKYGIQTPYTSYLVLETPAEFAKHGIALKGGYEGAGNAPDATSAGAAPRKRPNRGFGDVMREAEKMKRRAGMTPEDSEDSSVTAPLIAPRPGMALEKKLDGYGMGGKSITGKDAVKLAEDIAKLRAQASSRSLRDYDGRGDKKRASRVKRTDGRTFFLYAGFWIDSDFTAKQQRVHVKYLSDAYFKVIEKLPELKKSLALGGRLVVVVNNTALIIDDEGKETVADADLAKLMGK